MQTVKALNSRAAIKKFDTEKKISAEMIEEILDILILTPSAYGLQPWKFVLVENEEVRSQLKPFSWNQDQITDASHLIVICTLDKIDESLVEDFINRTSEVRGIDKSNLEGYKTMMINNIVKLDDAAKASWATAQAHIALGNLVASLAFEGIDLCPIAGFEAEKYSEILGLKEKGLKACLVCPIGYRSSEDVYSKMPKVRFKKENLIIKI